MSKTVLEIKNVSKYFGKTKVVDNLSFEVTGINDNVCLSEENCTGEEFIEMKMLINTGFSEVEMTVNTTDTKYKWIMDTTKYMFARIKDGKVVVGIAEFKIK